MKKVRQNTYSIDEGPRFIIKKITTNVDKIFDKEIFFPLNKFLINMLVIITTF